MAVTCALANRHMPDRRPLYFYVETTKALLAALAENNTQAAKRIEDELFDGLVNLSVHHSHHNFILGLIRLLTGRVEEALRCFRVSATQDPRNIYALSALADLGLMFDQGDVPAARKRIEEIESHQGREDIHVFGDSHAEFCFRGIARCRVHWLRNRTMHGIGRDGPSSLDFSQYGVTDGQAVALLFGEIDVRAHIARQRDLQRRGLEPIIDELVSAYERVILANRGKYPNTKVVIVSIIPPSDASLEPMLPNYGDIGERIAITRWMNAKLELMAYRNAMSYLDLHSVFRDESGALDNSFKDDWIHVRKEFHALIAPRLDRALATPDLKIAP